MVNKTYCPLPFIHSCTNVGGRNKPCCRFSDKEYIDKISPRDYFYGSKMTELRNKMLKGEYIKGCEKCYRDEKLGRKSYRQTANQDFSNINKNNPEIRYIEVGLSNSCNFACVTCDAAYSTTWWKDIDAVNSIGANKKKKKKQVVYTDFDFVPQELKKVEMVKILGGEPFMEPRNIKFLQSLLLENINLQIVTNCSVKPNKEWQNIFVKCKKLNVDISLDGEGKTAEFVRYGTNWKKVIENIKWWKDFKAKHTNIEISFHFVVHNLNIHNINNYLEFSRKYFPTRFDILQQPYYLDIQILPKNKKEKFIKKIKNQFVTRYLQLHLEHEDLSALKMLKKYKKTLEKIR